MQFLSIIIQNNLDIVFFFYGLAFILIGIAVFIHPRKEPVSVLPEKLWILGWFALIHGTNEIMEMWILIKHVQNPIFLIIQSICLLVSYAFLFEFGRRCFKMINKDKGNILNPLSKYQGWHIHTFIVVAITAISLSSIDFHKTLSLFSRYLLGFPGGVLAGTGILTHYFTRKRKMEIEGIQKYVLMVGISFIFYGILGGLIVAKGDFFPSNWLNKEMFLSVFKFPVQVFRAIAAICASWGIINILKIVNMELQEKIKNTLFESSPDCVANLALDGKYITINPAGVSLHELNSPSEIIGTDCRDWFASEKRQELNTAINKAAMNKTSTLRHKSINKNHSEVWWDSIISPIKNTNEEIGSILIVSRDVTQQHNNEEKIRKSNEIQYIFNKTLKASLEPQSLTILLNEFLKDLFSLEWLAIEPKGGIFLKDKKSDTLLLKANYNLSKTILNKCEKVPFGKCLCGKAASTGKIIFKSVLDENHEITYNSVHAHGHYCAPIKSKNTLLGVLNIYTKPGHKKNEDEISFLSDVTRLLASLIKHKLLVEEHLELINVVEQSDYSVILMDTEGDVIYVNKAFEKITGLKRRDVIWKKPEILKQIFEVDDVKKIWPKIQDGEPLQNITSQTKPDGNSIKMNTIISPIKDVDKKIISYAIMQRDISSEMDLENQLRQSQKMEAIGLLAGGIAHDFNNILMVINGYAQFTSERFAPESPTAMELGEIKNAGSRAAALTHQLLAFSRKQIFVPTILNLNDLIENMNKMLQRTWGENIEYKTDYDSGIKPIKADPNHIEQIILNLAINAHDAMPNGGKLLIKTENISFTEQSENIPFELKPGNYVLLSVQDTGSGMTPEIASRIFEPFYTTKEAGSGTGLGLSTVYGIVKQSSGVITVDSKPNEGSTFNIYFPAAKSSSAPLAPPKSVKKDIKINATILLVDDDASIRGMTHRILIDKGVTVLDFRSAEEALLFSEKYEGNIDLLITDILLEKMNGFELADKIREKRSDVQIIFMSGHTDPKILKQRLINNKFPFLQKPVTLNTLFENIENVLNKKTVN